MRTTLHMTQTHPPELVQQIRASEPGMAHWAGSGPAGKTCGECQHWNFWRQIRNASGAVICTEQHKGCQKYQQLTNKKGPEISRQLPACRHFQERVAGSQG